MLLVVASELHVVLSCRARNWVSLLTRLECSLLVRSRAALLLFLPSLSLSLSLFLYEKWRYTLTYLFRIVYMPKGRREPANVRDRSEIDEDGWNSKRGNRQGGGWEVSREFKPTSSTGTPRELIELIVVYSASPSPHPSFASLRLIRHVRIPGECKLNGV